MAIGLLIWLFLQMGAQAQVPPEEWTREYANARERAAQVGKPMLIMFSSQWCPPCKTMTQEVLPQQSVRNEVQGYVAVYLDSKINDPLFQQYNIETEPTFVVMDTGRLERDRMLGLVPQDLFSSRLRFWSRVFELEALLETAPNEAELWRRKGLLLASQLHLNQARDAFARAVSITQGDVPDYRADLGFTELIASRANSLEEMERKLDEFKAEYPNSPRVKDILFVRSLIARQRGQEELFLRLLDKYTHKAEPGAMFAEQASMLLNRARSQHQQQAPNVKPDAIPDVIPAPASQPGETVAANPTSTQ